MPLNWLHCSGSLSGSCKRLHWFKSRVSVCRVKGCVNVDQCSDVNQHVSYVRFHWINKDCKLLLCISALSSLQRWVLTRHINSPCRVLPPPSWVWISSQTGRAASKWFTMKQIRHTGRYSGFAEWFGWIRRWKGFFFLSNAICSVRNTI